MHNGVIDDHCSVSLSSQPAIRAMLRVVPSGKSLLGCGTTTIRVPLRNFCGRDDGT
jgi:hypothetical protein